MQTLRLVFGTTAGDPWAMTLRYPKDNLTAQNVTDAMQAMIDADVFASGLTDIVSAQIIDREVTDLVNNG
jgi:hypothetical protein